TEGHVGRLLDNLTRRSLRPACSSVQKVRRTRGASVVIDRTETSPLVELLAHPETVEDLLRSDSRSETDTIGVIEPLGKLGKESDRVEVRSTDVPGAVLDVRLRNIKSSIASSLVGRTTIVHSELNL